MRKPGQGMQGGSADIFESVTRRSFLTFGNLENFKKVKSRMQQTVDVWVDLYIPSSLTRECGFWYIYNHLREASACLLVLLYRAISRASDCENEQKVQTLTLFILY